MAKPSTLAEPPTAALGRSVAALISMVEVAAAAAGAQSSEKGPTQEAAAPNMKG